MKTPRSYRVSFALQSCSLTCLNGHIHMQISTKLSQYTRLRSDLHRTATNSRLHSLVSLEWHCSFAFSIPVTLQTWTTLFFPSNTVLCSLPMAMLTSLVV